MFHYTIRLTDSSYRDLPARQRDNGTWEALGLGYVATTTPDDWFTVPASEVLPGAPGVVAIEPL